MGFTKIEAKQIIKDSIEGVRKELVCGFNELSTSLGTLSIDVETSQNLDAAGRTEISEVITSGDYNMIEGINTLYWDSEVSGTGAVTHDAVTNSVDLSGSAANDFAIIQTKQWHPYFSGKAQQPEFTMINFQPEAGAVKRVGYYSSATTGNFDTIFDGAYLESSNGTVKLVVAKGGSLTTIEESEWLVTNTDWTKFQVALIDFLYLGGAILKLFLFIDGQRVLAHQHLHAGYVADVIFDSPDQPLRAEVRGTGSFKFVCGQVSTMGSVSQLVGIPVVVDTGGEINASTAGTEYVALAIRSTTRASAFVLQNVISATSAGASETYMWKARLNGGISGGALSFSSIANTGMEYAVGNGTITHDGDGFILSGGSAVARTSHIAQPELYSVREGSTIDGVYDIIYITYTPNQNGQDFTITVKGLRY